MLVNKSAQRWSINLKAWEVDFSRNWDLSGNLFIPLERGLSIRCYPYEDYWFMMDGEVMHVQSKDDFDILVNKFTTRFALERL